MVRFVFAAFLVTTALLGGTAAAQAPARVDVVALMVEFQPDTTRFTTGNGTFDGPLFDGVTAPSIDPLPHNPDYFRAHLTFLENYVRRASDGRTSISTHLLPEVVRVSKTMGSYSPTGRNADSDDELSKLSSLIEEAWTLADQSGMALPSGLDPATTAFIVFHAGVGRDLELVGTTLDKTPEDIPSIFFDEKALDRLGAGGITLDGFPVSNSMIIPRTESRRGVNVLTSEPFLIELSINGLLAASFFNYLGVPDLFDTATGESAIGPFGVMDALGIFAYSGLFPPEPSAWTKQFLGWSDPVQADTEGQVRLQASGMKATNHVARIPISDAEYFLVENRHRDPEGDGLRLRIWTHEGISEVVFQNGDPEFNDQTVSGFPGGVVLEADDYDAALPGGLDENENPLLGGILIWHVDENRLADGMEDNAVNADRAARAIDLEEADGAQDIGYNSTAGFFGPRFDLGTPFDFWYEGNPVSVRTSTGRDIQLYENRFGADTYPSNLSNAGVAPGFQLQDFSAAGPEMTFRVVSADSQGRTLLAEWTLGSGAAEDWVTSPEDGAIWPVADPEGFFGWYQTSGNLGHWFWQPVNGRACSLLGEGRRPAFDGQHLYVESEEAIWRITPLPDECSAQLWHGYPDVLISITTPAPAFVITEDGLHLFVGMETAQGPVLWTLADDAPQASVLPIPSRIQRIITVEGAAEEIYLLTDAGVLDGQGQMIARHEGHDWSQAVMHSDGAAWTLAWTSEAGGIHLLREDGELNWLPAPGACTPEKLRWYDLDGGGDAELMYLCGNHLVALHDTGAVLAGFPFTLPSMPISSPLVAITRPGTVEIFIALADGSLAGIEVAGGTARMADGHPLPVGSRSGIAPLLTSDAVVTLSGAGTIRAWSASFEGTSHVTDDGYVLRLEAEALPMDGEGLLRGEDTYNWPNPITEGQTRIRFATSEPSDIRIDIVDMNGLLIDRIDTAAPGGGQPAEVLWTTEAGSGVYLARVRATSTNSGQSATRLIRMAIIR